MQVSFRDAAALIGLRSRSTLYRWLSDGLLAHGGYLRGHEGAWRIETHPPERMPFVRWAEAVIGAQGPRRQSERQPGPWDHIPEQLRAVDGSEPFWCRFGRIAPDEPLSDDQYWETVARVVEGMRPGYKFTGDELADFAYWLDDARADVAAGVRWDQAKWDRATAEMTLADMPCRLCAADLREMLAAGRVPADLVPEVEAALDAMPAEA